MIYDLRKFAFSCAFLRVKDGEREEKRELITHDGIEHKTVEQTKHQQQIQIDGDVKVKGKKKESSHSRRHRELITPPFFSLPMITLKYLFLIFFFVAVQNNERPMPIIAVFNSLVTSRYLFENDFNVRGERKKDQIAHFPSIISPGTWFIRQM